MGARCATRFSETVAHLPRKACFCTQSEMLKMARHTRRLPIPYVLFTAVIAVAGLSSAAAATAFPFLNTWSESFAGTWTAVTHLSVEADEILHSASIYSSVDYSTPPQVFDTNTSWFRSDEPIRTINCSDPGETVTTQTWHRVEIGASVYWDQSSDMTDCGSVNE